MSQPSSMTHRFGWMVYSGSNFAYYLEKIVVELMYPPYYTLNGGAWEMYMRGCFRRLLVYFYKNEDERTRRDVELLTENGLHRHFKNNYEIFIAPTEGDFYTNLNKVEELRLPYLPMLLLLDAEEGEERWFVYPYGELTVSKILSFVAEYEHDELPRHFRGTPAPAHSTMQESLHSAIHKETQSAEDSADKVKVQELVSSEFRDKIFSKFSRLTFVLLYGYDKSANKALFEAAIQPLRHLPNSSFYQINMETEEIPYYHFERHAGSVLVATPFNDSVEIYILLRCVVNRRIWEWLLS